MADDEGTVDWAAREAAEDLRKAREAANAFEKGMRDARLKDERGLEVFKQQENEGDPTI